MIKSISITGYRRPKYFRQLLECLVENDLHGWKVEIQLEPSPYVGDYIGIAKELLSGYQCAISVNPYLLGVRLNPFALLSRLFEGGSDIVLYLEEDMVISRDAVELANWYSQNAQDDIMCLSLLAGASPGLISCPGHEDILFKSKMFNSWGFALTRQNWSRHFQPRWMIDYPSSLDFDGKKTIGWDWSMFHYLARSGGLYALSPVTARATHSGRDGGTHQAPAWHDLVFDLPLAGGTPHSYRVSPIEDLPRAVYRSVLSGGQTIDLLLKLSGPEIPMDRSTALDRAFAKATAFHKNERFSLAEIFYRELLALDPEHGDAWSLLGMLYLQMHRYSEANTALMHAVKFRPDDPDIYNNLGNSYAKCGDVKSAMYYFDRALELCPGHPDALMSIRSLSANSERAESPRGLMG
jgi:tetratricopeptide (TPR) repeat protein